MQIARNDKFQKIQNPSFGQILPKHLFVNMPNFGTDKAWAESMIDIIEFSQKKVERKANFNTLLDDIAKKYQNFLSSHTTEHNKTKDVAYLFGKLRTEDLKATTYIAQTNRYAPYIEKVLNFAKDKGDKIVNTFNNFPLKINQIVCKQDIDGVKAIPLSKIKIALEDLPEDLHKILGEKLIAIDYAPQTSVKPALKHIEKTYNKLIENGKPKTAKELEAVNKNIGEIHWYFAQATPYYRGSAGIADVLTKTLYEGLGVQVSPLKKGIGLDLEAYVRPLDDYAKKYHTFFEKPPEIMRKNLNAFSFSSV